MMHHVDWQSFQLEHLKKVLRAQRQVEDAGHRYVVLYWAPDDNINKKNGEQDGNLMSLRLALPNDGKGMVYAISPGPWLSSTRNIPCIVLQTSITIAIPNLSREWELFTTVFRTLLQDLIPIVGSSSGNSTVQRPYTYWRRRCADRIAAVWLDTFINGNSSSIGSNHQEMFTPHYWLIGCRGRLGRFPASSTRSMGNEKS